MERVFKERVAHLAVKLGLVDETRLAPILETTSGSLLRRLLDEGLLDLAGRDRIYAALRAALDRGDPLLRERRKDQTLVKLALEKGWVTRETVQRYQAERQAVPQTERLPMGETLRAGGALTQQQLDQLQAEHGARYAGCAICGQVVARSALSAGKACRRCGWPLTEVHDSAAVATVVQGDTPFGADPFTAVDPFVGRQIGNCVIKRRSGAGDGDLGRRGDLLGCRRPRRAGQARQVGGWPAQRASARSHGSQAAVARAKP